MSRLGYLLTLLGCLLVTAPLELLLHARVYARPGRLVRTLVPVVVVFVGWDLWAVHTGQWRFDLRRTLGVRLPGGLPLEELLFFVVVPTCVILTFEAIRALRGWPAGDE